MYIPQFNTIGGQQENETLNSLLFLLLTKKYMHILSIDTFPFLPYLLKLQIYECKYWWGCQGNKDTKASILLLQANSLDVKSLENVQKKCIITISLTR